VVLLHDDDEMIDLRNRARPVAAAGGAVRAAAGGDDRQRGGGERGDGGR
jgi:hypothetical protein